MAELYTNEIDDKAGLIMQCLSCRSRAIGNPSGVKIEKIYLDLKR